MRRRTRRQLNSFNPFRHLEHTLASETAGVALTVTDRESTPRALDDAPTTASAGAPRRAPARVAHARGSYSGLGGAVGTKGVTGQIATDGRSPEIPGSRGVVCQDRVDTTLEGRANHMIFSSEPERPFPRWSGAIESTAARSTGGDLR